MAMQWRQFRNCSTSDYIEIKSTIDGLAGRHRTMISHPVTCVICLTLLLTTTATDNSVEKQKITTRYDGHQVLEIVQQGTNWTGVQQVMTELGPEVSFWRPPIIQTGSGLSTSHVFVPRHLVNSFKQRLQHTDDLTYRTLIDNVQRLIDIEQFSNKKYRRWTRQTSVENSIVGRYPTYEEVSSWLNNISTTHSDICRLVSIGRSFEGRDIFVLKIFDQSSNSDQPVIWIDAGIHAREWISVSTAVYIIDQILLIYKSQSNSLSRLVRSVEWHISPILNPDGYCYTHSPSGNRLWRKNRAIWPTTSFSLQYNRTCVGTDLNRNFDFQWHAVSVTTEPCYEDYIGPAAACENETIVISNYLKSLASQRSLGAVLTLHSYSEMMLTRWAYTVDLVPPERNITQSVMMKAVNAIYNTNGENYTFGSAPEILYSFSGGLADWVRATLGVRHSYELELRDRGNFGFLLPTNYVIPVGAEIWAATRVIAERVIEEYVFITNRTDVVPATYQVTLDNSSDVTTTLFTTSHSDIISRRTEVLLIALHMLLVIQCRQFRF